MGDRRKISLVLADVDGTLVDRDKVLTERARAAVRALREAGIRFAITSGRPPLGMAMLFDPLEIDTPIAGFNGGLFVDRHLTILARHTVPEDVAHEAIDLIRSHGLDPWVYRGNDWLILDPDGPHVAREAHTVRFEPHVVESFDGATSEVAKIVGVSDDHDVVAAAAAKASEVLGDDVSASRSQPYYVDVTHPDANKGAVVRYLSRRYEVPLEEIATIGDMPNDVLMFAHSGLSIAMGNADREVQRAARRVTGSNEDDGFAHAVERFILGHAGV